MEVMARKNVARSMGDVCLGDDGIEENDVDGNAET